MSHPREEHYVAEAARASGAEARISDGELELEVAGRTVSMPLPDWEDFDFRRAFPGRARGDQREFLLATALQDAAPAAGTRKTDDELRESLREPNILPAADTQSRTVIAEVLADQYWITPRRVGGITGSRRPTVFPLHSALPINFTQRGRYKMFRGDFLLFFCWAGSDFDPGPIDQLFELMNDRSGLSMLDTVMINGTIAAAGDGAPREANPQGLLASDQAAKVRAGLEAEGPYCPEPLDRFRQDLQAALAMPLPRHDRVEAVILTMSLHLALYYYEVAFRLGQDLELIERVLADRPPQPARTFAGALRFRVGTGGDRPVRRTDGCAESWRELDDRYLIALSANILAANLLNRLHAAWEGTDPGPPNPPSLAAAVSADADLRRAIDVGARVLGVLFASRGGQGTSSDELAAIAENPDGVPALRSTILRHRVRSLKHLGRDVVNRLINTGFAGSLRQTRGNVRFFELDEAFVFLLVRFITARAGETEVPYESFLDRLAEYGLSPQDDAERELLAAALERLGMLHRYSDAGEAQYVRHLF